MRRRSFVRAALGALAALWPWRRAPASTPVTMAFDTTLPLDTLDPFLARPMVGDDRFRVFTEAVLSSLGRMLPANVFFLDQLTTHGDVLQRFNNSALKLPDPVSANPRKELVKGRVYPDGYQPDCRPLSEDEFDRLMDDFHASLADVPVVSYLVKVVGCTFVITGGQPVGALEACSVGTGRETSLEAAREISVSTAAEVAAVLAPQVPDGAVLCRLPHIVPGYGIESTAMCDARACVRTLVGATHLERGVRERLFQGGLDQPGRFVTIDLAIGVPG